MRRAVVDEEKEVPAFSGKFTVQSTHPVFKKSIVVAFSERSMFELTTLDAWTFELPGVFGH